MTKSMWPLFESIKVLDGSLLNIEYHNARLNRSRRELFGHTDAIDLRDVARVPPDLGLGEYKCRVVYATSIEQFEFVPYQRRTIKSLTLVECDTIEYAHKFVDRTCIDFLLHGTLTDDIMIIKHGRITDASFANIVFYDGTKWITPSAPLLPGTARARLLDHRRITADEIRAHDLKHFKKAVLINAMLDLKDACSISMQDII